MLAQEGEWFLFFGSFFDGAEEMFFLLLTVAVAVAVADLPFVSRLACLALALACSRCAMGKV